MTTKPSAVSETVQGPENSLKPSRFDYAGSWLVALLVLTTIANVGLLIVWFSSFATAPDRDMRIFVTYPQLTQTSAPKAMAQPTLGELPDFNLDPTPDFESLALIRTMTPGIVASIPPSGAEIPGEGDDPWTDDGGPDRKPGGPDVVPTWIRWELKFDQTSRATYARQLDYFKIELGAVGGVDWVDYASELSQGTPKTRQGKSIAEKRIYMTWQRGTLLRFDEQLLAAADIPTENRIILHFLSDEFVETLTKLEAAHAERPMEQLEKTVFTLHRKGDGFEWRVESQTFRPQP